MQLGAVPAARWSRENKTINKQKRNVENEQGLLGLKIVEWGLALKIGELWGFSISEASVGEAVLQTGEEE